MRRRLRKGPPGSAPLALVLLAPLGLATIGCDRPPAADQLREWAATDHDRNDEKDKLLNGTQAASQASQRRPKQPQQPQQEGGGGGGDVQSVLIDGTWKAQCLRCHGATGHGDGPEGPMVKAPDLTRADWQEKVQDAEIAATITGGRNKMPKFDLPAPVVQGLVARIRAARER